MDIGSLIPLVSQDSIAEEALSLPNVNELWSLCTVFLTMAKGLQHHNANVPFNARFQMEMYLGKQFKDFYEEVNANAVSIGSHGIRQFLRPCILRVKNMLNLATAVHHHALLNKSNE